MAICQCQGEERRVMTDVSDRWPQTLFVQIRFQSFSRHWMSGKIDRGEKSQLYRNHSILNNIQQQSNIVPSNSHLQEVIISYVQQNLNSAKHGDGDTKDFHAPSSLLSQTRLFLATNYFLLIFGELRISILMIFCRNLWDLTCIWRAFLDFFLHCICSRKQCDTQSGTQTHCGCHWFKLRSKSPNPLWLGHPESGFLTMWNTPIVTSTFCSSLKASLSNVQHLFQHIQHGCHHRFSIGV